MLSFLFRGGRRKTRNRALISDPDFNLQVLPRDLYNLKLNLIEHIISEPEPQEEAISQEPGFPPEEKPKIPAGKSRLVREEIAALGHEITRLADKLRNLETQISPARRKLRRIEEAEQTLAEKHEALAREMDSALSRIEELIARSREKAEAEIKEHSRELEMLTERTEKLADLQPLTGRVEKLAREIQNAKQELGRIKELEQKAGRLEEALSKRPPREEVENLAAGLKELQQQLRELRDSLREELAELAEEHAKAFASASDLSELRAALENLEQKTTGKALLTKVYDYLEIAATRYAKTEELNALEARLGELREELADKEWVRRLESGIERLNQEEETLKEELSALKNAQEELAAESRKHKESLAAGIQELELRSATKEALERLADALKTLEKRAADQDALERLGEKIREVESKAATHDELHNLASRVKALSEESAKKQDTEALARKLEDEKNRFAARERVVALSAQVENLRQTAAAKAEMEKLAARVAELEARLLEKEEPRAALEAEAEEKMQAPPRPRSTGEPGPQEKGLERIAAEVVALEGAVRELQQKLSRESKTDLPFRLSRVEQKLLGLEAALSTEKPEQKPPGSRGDAPRAFSLPGIAPSAYSRLREKGAELLSRPLLLFAPGFLLAALVGSLLSFWLYARAERDASAKQTSSIYMEESTNLVYDESALPLMAPVLELPEEMIKLREGKIDISGYAPGASVAVLYVNTEKAGETKVEHAGFFFREVPLEYGVNVIQVKARDAGGREANSLARLIERESRGMARLKNASLRDFMRGPRELPYLALTIDAGATDRRADRLLSVLKKEKVVATFFLTGRFIEKYPEVVKKIVADGHEVGNHTYSHPHLTTFEQNRRHYTRPGITREMLQEELLKTKELFESLTGEKMTGWWRAPYGEYNQEILAWAEEVGFKHVSWTRTPRNFDMLDWVADERSRFYLDRKGLLERFLSIDNGEPGSANGGIILVHLGSARNKDFLDEILPAAISKLRSRNYRFVTVSRMFAR